jgi:hypothetical protein
VLENYGPLLLKGKLMKNGVLSCALLSLFGSCTLGIQIRPQLATKLLELSPRSYVKSGADPSGTPAAQSGSPPAEPPSSSIEEQVTALARDLNLTSSQRQRIRILLEEQQRKVQTIVFDRSLSQEQRMAQFSSLGASLAANIRGLLDDQQKKRFDQINNRKAVSTIHDEKLPSSRSTGSVPKLATDLHPGTYKYRVQFDNDGQNTVMNLSTTIVADRTAWHVTDLLDGPRGQVTDKSTLDRNSLVLLKRNLVQGYVALNIDFSNSRALGGLSINGVQQQISVDLAGPLFADAAGWEEVIACLPLAPGYTTTFRNFDLQKQAPKMMQLKVAGVERVAVPAGTFEAYRVELISLDGGPEKSTVWISLDSRKPVKVSAVLGATGRANMTAELLESN